MVQVLRTNFNHIHGNDQEKAGRVILAIEKLPKDHKPEDALKMASRLLGPGCPLLHTVQDVSYKLVLFVSDKSWQVGRAFSLFWEFIYSQNSIQSILFKARKSRHHTSWP
jgi:hypothetical protein